MPTALLYLSPSPSAPLSSLSSFFPLTMAADCLKAKTGLGDGDGDGDGDDERRTDPSEVTCSALHECLHPRAVFPSPVHPFRPSLPGLKRLRMICAHYITVMHNNACPGFLELSRILSFLPIGGLSAGCSVGAKFRKWTCLSEHLCMFSQR